MNQTPVRLLLAVALLLPGVVLGTPSASAQQVAGDSAVTQSAVCPPAAQAPNCKSEFGDLKVTVSQTKNLIDQIVQVSWTGGKPTPFDKKTNFLQIMQCWGGDSGPDPTQCYFGTTTQVELGNAGTRTLESGPTDQQDPMVPIPVGALDDQLPFWAPGKPKPGDLVPSKPDPFLDPQLTNELPRVPTRDDGTGEAFFDVQTLRQNAGFDCGAPVGAGSTATGQACWLVIVPRGSTEVNGKQADSQGLHSSPLSRTNFSQKIAFRLEFLPVTQSCTIGAAERPIFGHEGPLDAVGRWQRTLCAGSGGALYTYNQIPDDQARSRLVGNDAPGLVLFSNPIPPDQVPSDRPLVYAPVTLSGVAIAFNVDRQPAKPDPKAVIKAGARLPAMNLTPRVVAKLLTQSYRSAVSGTTGNSNYLKGNPESMTTDEDFLRDNPDYRGQAADPISTGLPQPIVQLATGDTTALVWSWILGDAQARAFLAGTPDDSDGGMVVNPENKGINTPPSTYPRGDQSCFQTQLDPLAPVTPVCTTDQFPFADDVHQAAQAVGRGLDFQRTPSSYDPTTHLVKYTKPSRQPYGQHHVMAVIDTATAARYEVPTAMLRPASASLTPPADFVAPTTKSMLAGLAAMKASGVPGVQKPDPLTTDLAAYPLTTVSYAAAAPALMDKAAGKDYANFLRYAVDKGQEPGLGPGQLPFGYVPLPEPLRAQTRAVADTIEAKAGIPVTEKTLSGKTTLPGTTTKPVTTKPGTTTPGTTTPGTTNPGSTTPGPTLIPAGTDVPRSAQAGRPETPGATAPVAAAARRTPALPVPAVGALLVALFVCGGVAATLAPVTHFFGATQPNETGEGGDATDRTEARSLPSWLAARLAQLARRR